MAYPHYTKCVQLKDFHPKAWPAATANTAVTGALSAIGIAAAAATGVGLVAAGIVIAVILAATVFALSYVKWWLYGRLICLGGVNCAIGMLVSVEPPDPNQSGFSRFDTDYSFDLLLAPSLPCVPKDTAEGEPIQGRLIAQTAALKSAGLPFEGQKSTSCDPSCPSSMSMGPCNCAKVPTYALHCEIEGPGMQILYQALKASVALLAVSEALSWFCDVPVFGWIACAIAAILLVTAGAVSAAGLYNSRTSAARPSDVNPGLGDSLHTNDCTGTGADLLMVTGEWVYDSLHNGLNELHPVHSLQKISSGGWSGVWPFDASTALAAWCGAVTAAHSQSTRNNQQQPENQWKIHPNVDGCINAGGRHFGLEP